MRRPHVLVARLDSEGDVLLAGPAVRAVAAGAGRVTMLVGPRGQAAATLLPGVDAIAVHRAPWIDPEPDPVSRVETLALVDRLAALGIDQAFVLTSFHQSALPLALLLRLAEVPVVAATSEDYPGSLLDVRHRIPDDVHEVRRSLSLVATLAGVAVGGALALLMRIQLAVPDNDFLSAELYNQAFTVHGSVMMFLFAIPVFEAIAVLFLPQMLGARDLPFPRLSAFGFWCFLLGGIFLCGSIFFGAAPRGGWFMYPPLTSTYQPDIGADIWLLGFSCIEIAAIAATAL